MCLNFTFGIEKIGFLSSTLRILANVMTAVVLQILQAVALYTSKSPLISLKTTPVELEAILEDFDDRLKKFQQLTTCLLSSAKVETGGGNPLKPIIDQSESDILLSFVQPEITVLLGKKKFNNGKSTGELTLLLQNLIGIVDPEEKKQKLKIEFAQIGRRTATNESFTEFIDRLELMASEITTSDYKSELAADQFARDLRPMDLDILQLFPDDWEDESGIDRAKAQARILDQRKMHRKKEAANHKLEIDSISSKIDEMTQQHKEEISKLTNTFQKQLELQSKQLEASQSKNEQLIQKLLSKVDQKMATQVNQIQSKPENINQPNAQQNDDKPKKPKNKNKAPFWLNKNLYCDYCGSKNCKNGADCKGNDSLWCMFCESSGHSHTSRRFHGSKN